MLIVVFLIVRQILNDLLLKAQTSAIICMNTETNGESTEHYFMTGT